MNLTNNSQNILNGLYREYLFRQKEGFTSTDAARFESVEFLQENLFPDLPLYDIELAIKELKSHELIKTNILGSIFLLDKSISIMEHRLKNGLLEAVDILSKFV